MKLSSHEEYGLRCLLRVAHQGAKGSATIPEISRHEGISRAYVGKLMRILRQGGFVKAARGKTGGYTLALPPERLCVGDALPFAVAASMKRVSVSALRKPNQLRAFDRVFHPHSLAYGAGRR